MKKLENSNTKKFSIYFAVLALTLIIGCINGVDTTLDNYGKFNWYLDYSNGFMKRALPGQLLHFFYFITDQQFIYNYVNESIKHIHIIFVILFICLLGIYYLLLVKKHTNKPETITILFGFLVSSYFMKEILNLTGYLDIIVSTLVLLSYILYHQKFYVLSVVTISVSCLISEISMFFWLPVIALNIFIIKVPKSRIFLFFIPVLFAVAVHFLSCFPETLLKMYKNSDISEGMIEYINNFFKEQKDIPKLISDRLSIIYDNIFNVFIGFLFIGFTSFSFFAITLEKIIKFNISKIYTRIIVAIIFFICSFAPFFLILLAVDFWRFVYFSIFSSFLHLIILCDALNDFFVKSKLSNLLIIISFFVSIFTLFSPPVKMSENKMTVRYNVELRSISDYHFDNYRLTSNKPVYLLQDYYNNRKGIFDRVGWNKDIYSVRTCKREGNVIPPVLSSPGRKKILVEGAFSNDDPDQVKQIELWGMVLNIHRNQKNIFDAVFPRDLAVRVPIEIVCRKSSNDWNIKQFVIVTVSE